MVQCQVVSAAQKTTSTTDLVAPSIDGMKVDELTPSVVVGGVNDECSLYLLVVGVGEGVLFP
jgi:hypothetical protein